MERSTIKIYNSSIRRRRYFFDSGGGGVGWIRADAGVYTYRSFIDMPVLQGTLETRADRVKDKHQEPAEEGEVWGFYVGGRSRAPRLPTASQ